MNYVRHLADAFDVIVAYHANVPLFTLFDLVHLFEVSQIGTLTSYGPRAQRPFKAVAGLTAHVWRTWGEQRMHAWAAQVDALHGNSRLLVQDLQPFHEKVYYTPNGVDPDVYHRTTLRDPTAPIVFGHVGKPNPRKGGDLIVNAARDADVELRLIQRTSKLALSTAEMVAWYQGIDVMVCASNMDGTPNTLLEGAACECALLSTPIGNMPEVIVEVNGYWANGYLTQASLPYLMPGLIYDPEQIQRERDVLQAELTERMRQFAAHPGTTRVMGQQARQIILNDWTWAHQVEHVRKMWTEILDE
jgi:glycosyltransferase involved in cell wall biosynthesis